MDERMAASIARLKNSRSSFEWQGFRLGRLQKAGFPIKGDPACRLEVWPGLKPDGTPDTWLVLRNEDGEPIATANFSHPPCGDPPLPPCED